MLRPKVLIIEHDGATRRQLECALRDEFELLIAGDPLKGLALAHEQSPTVILLDLDLPPNPIGPDDGLQCLGEIGKYGGNGKVIVLNSHCEQPDALQAIKAGAHDFFTKPVGLDTLKYSVRRACWIAELEQERQIPLLEITGGFEEMTGTSDGLRLVIAAIQKVAPTDVPVLITGESGTGKELAAKAIHARSLRKDGPFAPINCGAIPETLLESELFGHEKGAFTGAWQRKKGKLEYAQGGTLFLDEVGELPLTLQVKLLRFLQDQIIERVGGQRQIKVDARIIAATNVDLREAISQRKFRDDLYYRLGVIVIHIPPLRCRGEDVLLMAQLFLKRVGERMRKRVRGFTAEAIRAIQAHTWPGNVRELYNRIQRAVVMTETPYITPEDLDLPCSERDKALSLISLDLKAARQRLEAGLIVQALTLHSGNLRRAAEALGISRPTLYALIQKYKLRPKALLEGG